MNSADVKRIMLSERHAEVFEAPQFTKTTDKSWKLEQGGVYNAVGVGGNIAGRGANYIVVDDYILNRRSAESEAERNHQWSWFQDDILTRRHYPCSVLVMATRWHYDDIIGRIESTGTGEEWTILHLPKMLDAEPGPFDQRTQPGEMLLSPFTMLPWEYLEGSAHPDIDPFLKREPVPVTYEELQRRERVAFEARLKKNPYGVSALEQGRPTPKDGGLIQSTWFKRFGATPNEVAESADKVIISVDAAMKDNSANDRCAISVLAKKGPLIYLLEVDADLMRWSVLKERVRSMAARYPTATILIEDKANGTALIDELRGELPRVLAFEPSKYGNKTVRAQFAADRYESGSILHPAAPFPWVEEAEAELSLFPHYRYDDILDSISQGVIHLDSRKSGKQLLDRVSNVFSRFG